MDYICDWARSVHREAMIRQLKKIALPLSNNYSEIKSSIGSLSVTGSHRPRWPGGSISSGGGSISWRQRDSQLSQTPLTRLPLKLQEKFSAVASSQVANESPDLDSSIEDDSFHQYDSLLGVVRDPMYIRSRVLGLYITDSNFINLIQCTQKEEQSMAILKRIITRLEVEEPVRVQQSTLNDIETKWTGNRRKFQKTDIPQEIFHVLFTVSAYVESDWLFNFKSCYNSL